MAQRKPSSAGKPAAKKGTSRPAGKPTTGSLRAGATKAQAARKPPPRKPGRSIVNQKQTPWGVIASVVAVVLFAAAVVIVVLVTRKSSNGTNPNNRWTLPALPAAMAINGVEYHPQPNHTHITAGTVKYNRTPPTGGNHSPYWADCSGTVYPQPIANENAVHALEHGAVWVTYREGLPASQVATLAKNVRGRDHVFMSPFPNLRSPVSLQAWGYQLFIDNKSGHLAVADPRIPQFISTLVANPKITPELDQTGQAISCAQPTFVKHPSTFGHPLFAPAAGS